MSFLGISFGAKKNKTDQTKDVNTTETTNQTQTGTKTQEGTSTTNSSTTGTSQTQGSSSTSQAGTSQTTGATTGVTQQTSSSFSDPVLKGIESLVSDMFGSVGGKASISDFNVDEFVKNGLASAKSSITDRINTDINQLISGIGGSAGSNSAAALLANKMQNSGAAELAGIQSQLTAQGEGIARENALAGNTIDATGQGFLGQLLAALKGGTTTVTGTEATTSSQNQQTQQTGSTVTNESTQQQQSQQSTTTQQLLEQLAQVLNGTSTTVGTEKLQGTTSEKGGGLSLAI